MAQAHRPIHNNDDWISASVDVTSSIVSRYVTDQSLSMTERRIINGIIALIGHKPETATQFAERLDRETDGSKAETTVAAAVEALPPGTVVTEGAWDW